MPSDQRHCTQKVELVAGYAAAVATYHAAVNQLEAGMITGSAQIYRDRYQVTETARTMCEAAQRALDQHVAHHGC